MFNQSRRDSFKFEKSRQPFICTHNETLSIVTMCVCNPDSSPVGINRRDAAPTPTDFAEIVSDYFPVEVARLFCGEGNGLTSSSHKQANREFFRL
jgi:hypothetical protein